MRTDDSHNHRKIDRNSITGLGVESVIILIFLKIWNIRGTVYEISMTRVDPTNETDKALCSSWQLPKDLPYGVGFRFSFVEKNPPQKNRQRTNDTHSRASWENRENETAR
jgi:hypothetical protein